MSSLIRRYVGKHRAESGYSQAHQDDDLILIERAEAAAKLALNTILSTGEPCQWPHLRLPM